MIEDYKDYIGITAFLKENAIDERKIDNLAYCKKSWVPMWLWRLVSHELRDCQTNKRVNLSTTKSSAILDWNDPEIFWRELEIFWNEPENFWSELEIWENKDDNR